MRLRRSNVDRVPQSEEEVLRACEEVIIGYPSEGRERAKIEEQIAALKKKIEVGE